MTPVRDPLERARTAQLDAQALHTCARATRAESGALRVESGRRRDSVRRAWGRILTVETEAVDDGLIAWPAAQRPIEAHAHLVGRDAAIERAKTILCERHAIGRGDAYAILRALSHRRNEKVAALARRIVEDPAEPR